MYDIRNVGYEYLEAEKCRKEGDIENALNHYQAAIDNYEQCENEYMLSPSSPYEITEFGKPSPFQVSIRWCVIRMVESET